MRLITFIASLLLAGQAVAAQFYVSPTGSDSAAGSQAAPWKTVSKAASVAAAGDTVNVLPGVYKEAVNLTKSGSGNLNKISFVGQPGAIIDGTGLSLGQWGALVMVSASYVRVQGFEVRNSPTRAGIGLGEQAHHVDIIGNNIHNTSGSGIWVERTNTTPAFSTITRNKSHDNSQGGITMWRYEGGYWLLEGNEVYNNTGGGNYDGIQVGGGSGAGHHIVVRNNEAHDNGSADAGEDNLDLGGHALVHHYLVEGNYVHGGTGSFKVHSGDRNGSGATGSWYTDGVSGFHIVRFNRIAKGYVTYEYPNPIAMYNNTFYECGQCFFIYGSDNSKGQKIGDNTWTGGDAGRMVWKNNLFLNTGGSYMHLWGAPSGGTIDWTPSNFKFFNNVYRYGTGQKTLWNQTTYGPPVTQSVFSSYQSATGNDVGSTWTAAAITGIVASTTDWTPVPGSPAINAGKPLTFATAAGNNSTTLKVDRASYFFDGYCVGSECLGTADSIMVGAQGPIKIAKVDDANNTITLTTAATWAANDPVTLPFKGSAPDAGAIESGGSTPPPPSCTYTYSAFGACVNNSQSRTVLSSSPAGCVGTPVLTQSCTTPPPPGQLKAPAINIRVQ